MPEEESRVASRELIRWLVLLSVVVASLGAYFWLAPRSRPIVHSTVLERTK
jgi:hypothetical protein